MPSFEYKICVLTVTYGDRWQFLEQVLTRVMSFKPFSNNRENKVFPIYPLSPKANPFKDSKSDLPAFASC